MTEDIIRSFEFLCLGSRFRRIGERLQADAQQIMAAAGVSIQAGQFPFLAVIDRCGPLTIGELAEAIGITQPGVTRTLRQLTELGLVDTKTSDEDQRRKLVSLTESGRKLVEFSKREIWPRVEAAVRDLCGDLSGPLLQQLDAIEDGLISTPLPRRASAIKEKTP